MLNVHRASFGNPILQFGTGRFLQAHVDLLVSEALAQGQALGRITVVQSTDSAASSARTAALASGRPYPVHIRGLRDGQPVDERRLSSSVGNAVHADSDWTAIRAELAQGAVQVIISNTGDAGWRIDARDGPHLLAADAAAPRSFPAKLLVLLNGRWLHRPMAELSVLPCELLAGNGDRLCRTVCDLAHQWRLPGECIAYLQRKVVWANSLVDRIVTESLDPVGAVAEPYALWAIERRAGLILPCRHEAMVITDQLARYERLKLYLLNLGHTMLAEHWLRAPGPAEMTVRQAMLDGGMRAAVESVWGDEVLPVFDALGERHDAESYLVNLRDRLLNPYLSHRLASIAQDHGLKKQRRLAPVVALAEAQVPGLVQAQLRAALANDKGSTPWPARVPI